MIKPVLKFILIPIIGIFLKISSASACAIPIQDEKYNLLIKEIPTSSNEHYFVIPKYVDDQPFVSVVLVVSNKDNNDGQISSELHTKEKNNQIVARVNSFNTNGLEVSIWVTWQGESATCPIVGSKSIKVEAK
jgi:hypothetical protein